MSSGVWSQAELLKSVHQVGQFDCGKHALNVYLHKHALTNQQSGAARTYVTQEAGRVIGYYSLAAASAEYDKPPARVTKGLAKHPVPLTLLARLAVDRSVQGQGVGASLLQDALLRHLQAQQVIGSRALLVHAKDDEAAAFYLRYGFAPSPLDPYHLFLLTKDIQKTLGM